MPDRLLDLVAEHLRRFRDTQGLTQEQAAHSIGCSIPTYRALERTSRSRRSPDPKLSTLMRVLVSVGADETILAALAEHIDDAERIARSARHGATE
ncbi:helix-turn-helix domain-containing protein [Microbacterium sp. Mcb102]|uniref:helix-turn-helix domain-containing protein n=1 Tax=unclassified Microbacterium TaxID=2609290 RepID=UPI003967B384